MFLEYFLQWYTVIISLSWVFSLNLKLHLARLYGLMPPVTILASLPALAASEICAFLTRFQLPQFSSFAQRGHSETRLKYVKVTYIYIKLLVYNNEIKEQNKCWIKYQQTCWCVFQLSWVPCRSHTRVKDDHPVSSNNPFSIPCSQEIMSYLLFFKW